MSGGDEISKHNKLVLVRTRDATDFNLAELIALSRDKDREVRDWATFQLGSQMELDNAEVRQALRDRLEDSDLDTRCEAFVGLARRGDEFAVAPLLQEHRGKAVATLMVEAAGTFGRAEFAPVLQELRHWWDVDVDLLDKAIARCAGERGDAGNDNE
jgi:hypothetical protein